MDESLTISLPETIALTERLSKVNKKLSEWLEALDRGRFSQGEGPQNVPILLVIGGYVLGYGKANLRY